MVSGGEVGLAGEVVVGRLVGAGGGAEPRGRGRAGVGELGQTFGRSRWAWAWVNSSASCRPVSVTW